jgi:hypothetical protein
MVPEQQNPCEVLNESVRTTGSYKVACSARMPREEIVLSLPLFRTYDLLL